MVQMHNASFTNGHIDLPLTISNTEKHFKEEKGIEKMVQFPKCCLFLSPKRPFTRT